MVQTTDIFQTQHLAGLQSLINPYKNDLNSFPHKLPHMTYTLPKFLPRSLHPPKIVPPVIIVYLIYAFFFFSCANASSMQRWPCSQGSQEWFMCGLTFTEILTPFSKIITEFLVHFTDAINEQNIPQFCLYSLLVLPRF